MGETKVYTIIGPNIHWNRQLNNAKPGSKKTIVSIGIPICFIIRIKLKIGLGAFLVKKNHKT